MNTKRFFFAFFLSLFCSMMISAATYYVAVTNGSDSYTVTQAQSLATPWKTIKKAALMVAAGDIVLVKSGTYSGDIRFRISGTATQPITFKASPGENPIIDLNGGWPVDEGGVAGWWFGVVSMLSDYNIIDGFEIRNGTNGARLFGGGQGIEINGNNNTVRNCTVRNIQDAGIRIRGNSETIEGNTVYDACLNKLDAYAGVDWGSGIAISGDNTGNLKIGNVVRNNIVHNVWGEGIYGYYGISNTLMEGNVVYNIYALGIGLSGSTDGIIRNNLIYKSSDCPVNLGGWGGIAVVNDNQSTISDTCNNNLVCNNFIYGSNILIDRFLATSTSRIIDTKIYNNTIVNPAGNPIKLGGTQVNSTVRNNIFVGQWINTLYASVSLSSNNYWSTTPPSGFGLSSPTTDIIGDASLYLVNSPGSTTAGQLTKEWFRLTYDSPARNHGVMLSDVPKDAFDNNRDTVSPDISAFEYTNLVENPNFKTNTTNWSIEVSSPAAATIASVSQTGYFGNACKTTITNSGTATYHIQLKQNIPIASGKIYSIKFKASAAASRTIGILFQKLGTPYTTYWSQSSIKLTTTPTTYGPYTFVCSSTDASTNFKFLFGGSTTAVWIDDVEISDSTSPTLAPKLFTNNEKIGTEKSIRLFPNPTSDYVFINFDENSGTEPAKIKIVDISGKIVYKTELSQISNLRLSTNQLVKGLYFVEIIRGSDRYTSKLVIQ